MGIFVPYFHSKLKKKDFKLDSKRVRGKTNKPSGLELAEVISRERERETNYMGRARVPMD